LLGEKREAYDVLFAQIIAMGADGSGKQEVDVVSLFKHCKVGLALADSKKQCVAFGELSHPVSQGFASHNMVICKAS
jgi:hypothetical protein